MKQLLNRAETFGMFNGIEVDNWTELVVQLSTLSIEKTADKDIWIDGELSYTIVVKNIDSATVVNDVSVTDIIDYNIARLIDTSVMLGTQSLTRGVDFTYDEATGELVILPAAIGDIPAGESRTITFQVEFVQP